MYRASLLQTFHGGPRPPEEGPPISYKRFRRLVLLTDAMAATDPGGNIVL